MTDASRFRAGLAAAALAGCLLRLAFGLGYWTDRPLTRDESEYLSLARSLSAGAGFVYDPHLDTGSTPPVGRAPGYPAFLALAGGGGAPPPAVPAAVKIAQAVAGAAGVILLGLIGRRLAGPRAGWTAAALAAVYPPLVWAAAYALSEAIFWPVALGVALLFDRAAAGEARSTTAPDATARTAPGAALACGLLTGAGILIRPALLLFLPLAALLLVARRRWVGAAWLLAGVIVVVGPWTARNYAVHDRWMLVASDGGVTFWTGNHPLAIGEGDMAANPALKLDNQRLRSEHPDLTEEELEPIYYREALTWIRQHPGQWLWLEARKLFYLIVPIGPSYTLHSTLYFAASVASYVPALVLGVLGAARAGSTLQRTPGLWLLALSSVATALLFFPQERFRIPVIDPALLLLSSAVLARWMPPARTRATG